MAEGGNFTKLGRIGPRDCKLRPDFNPADKVQVEDDISASVVLPAGSLNNLDPEYPNKSVKLLTNCEALLFQRPDDAIHRGFDKDAESDHRVARNLPLELRTAYRGAGARLSR